MRNTLSVLGISLLLSFSLFSPAFAEINTGLWEITARLDMVDMPMNVAPQKSRQCLKKDHLVPSTQSQKGCTVTGHGVKGNTVTWSMECDTPQGPAVGEGKMTFRGNSMSGQSTITMNVNGQTVSMRSNLSGRRVGDCK